MDDPCPEERERRHGRARHPGDRGGDMRTTESAHPALNQEKPGLLWRTYEKGLRLLFKLYFTLVHRIRIEGLERVPKDPGKLIVIANHASFLDGFIIWA